MFYPSHPRQFRFRYFIRSLFRRNYLKNERKLCNKIRWLWIGRFEAGSRNYIACIGKQKKRRREYRLATKTWPRYFFACGDGRKKFCIWVRLIFNFRRIIRNNNGRVSPSLFLFQYCTSGKCLRVLPLFFFIYFCLQIIQTTTFCSSSEKKKNIISPRMRTNFILRVDNLLMWPRICFKRKK